MQEYGSRQQKLPAPTSVVWEDLTTLRTEGSRVWLNLLPDETRPTILESAQPSRVIWSSIWLSRPMDKVVLDLTADGANTALRFTLLAHGDLPDASQTGHIRKRMNELLFADLRFSYGQ